MRQKVLWPALAVVLLAAGCGGTTHRALPVVSITERDFHITAPHVFPTGEVRIVLPNKGPVSHELLTIHAARGRLPLRADGFTIDEARVHRRLPRPLRAGGPAARRTP